MKKTVIIYKLKSHLLPHLVDNDPLGVEAGDELTFLRVLVPGHHLQGHTCHHLVIILSSSCHHLVPGHQLQGHTLSSSDKDVLRNLSYILFLCFLNDEKINA